MKTFIINDREYKAKPFDFNMVCDLEDMGVSMADIQDKPTAATRAYFALCTGRGKVFAGQELQAHILGGGELSTLMEVMTEEMEKSDFFQALSKKTQEKNTEGQNEAK